MDCVTIDLKFAENKEVELSVTNSLWRRWNLLSNKLYTLYFGDKCIKSYLKPINGNENQVILSTKNVEELTIPFPQKIQATIDDTQIRFGPVMGVLTSEKNSTSLKLLKMLSSKDNKVNYTFLFSPSDVDWSTKTIVGTFSRSDDFPGWHRQKVAIPDVIYNRIFGRKRERSTNVQTLYKNFELYTNTKMFNPFFFNKESIHRLLEDKSEVAKYLPETFFSPSQTDIETLFKQYETIFLKPKNGLGGRGIYRITKSEDYYIYNTERTIIKYTSLQALLEKINLTKKVRKYLAQQGIALIKYNGRKVDFRVNLNKDIENKWVITGIAGKVAGESSVTTHIRLGGKVYSSYELLTDSFNENASNIIKDIEDAVLKLATSIDSLSLNRNIGELGLDIGVDTEGKVWMFEANSKPGRSIFKLPSLEEAGHNSINLLLEYTYYLSGFKAN